MAEIVNMEINEVVFESNDPEAIKAEADRLGKKWRKDGKDGMPYAIQGFDSLELASGVPHDPPPPVVIPEDKDRLVVNEEDNTVTVYGDAEPPVDFDGEIINAR